MKMILYVCYTGYTHRYVWDSNRKVVSRFIWLVFVLGGITLALYQIQERIVYYFTYPTSTSVDVVYVKHLRFPQVTICSENRFKKSAANQYGKTCNIINLNVYLSL